MNVAANMADTPYNAMRRDIGFQALFWYGCVLTHLNSRVVCYPTLKKLAQL